MPFRNVIKRIDFFSSCFWNGKCNYLAFCCIRQHVGRLYNSYVMVSYYTLIITLCVILNKSLQKHLNSCVEILVRRPCINLTFNGPYNAHVTIGFAHVINFLDKYKFVVFLCVIGVFVFMNECRKNVCYPVGKQAKNGVQEQTKRRLWVICRWKSMVFIRYPNTMITRERKYFIILLSIWPLMPSVLHFLRLIYV